MNARSPRRLFVDDFHVAQMSGLTRRMHAADKHPANPVIRPDKPWERRNVSVNCSTIYDPADRLFKMWYFTGEVRSCYAVSSDGVRWEKPPLGLVECDGSKDNNLVDGKVFYIVAGDDDFSPLGPDHRYQTIAYAGDKGLIVQSSADGVKWTDRGPCKVLGAGDTFIPVKSTRPFCGPDDPPGYPKPQNLPRYLGVARWCQPVGRFDGSGPLQPTRRVQALVEADDLRQWRNPIRILTPDEQDDTMAHQRIEAAVADGSLIHDCREDRRCEFYTMLIVPYEELYIGLLLIFDPSYEFGRIGKNNQPGPGHLQLVASRDLIDWQRLGGRQPFIDRGEPGQFDWAMAWYPCLPIVKDSRLWFYYSGNCTTHAGTRDPQYWENLTARVDRGELPGIGSVGLATLRRDGFVSLDADDRGGCLLTRVFDWPEGALHLNADARGGEVRISLCQPDGTPYLGCELSDPIVGDQLDAAVRWPQSASSQAGPLHTHGTATEAGVLDGDEYRRLRPGKKVRLKIHARCARLYSYWFV